jgi:hypothetical protein
VATGHAAAIAGNELPPSFDDLVSAAKQRERKSEASAFAVFMLSTSSTLVDCWIGKSAGFSSLRIRPV